MAIRFSPYLSLVLLLATACSTPRTALRLTSPTGVQEYEIKDGIPHGTWVERYPNRQLMYEMSVVDGVRSGPIRGWYPNGKLAIEGTYKDRTPVGTWTRWYETGTKWTEGQFTDGTPSSIWSTWDKSGNLISKEDLGFCKKYCPDGSVKIGSEPPKGYFVRCEKKTTDEHFIGKETSWYPSGTKWTEGSFRDYIAEGESVDWFENGKIARRATYKNGLPVGPVTFWYPSGIKQAEVEYEGTTPKVLRSWDTDGKPKSSEGQKK